MSAGRRAVRGKAWAATLLAVCVLLGVWPPGRAAAAPPPAAPVSRAGLAALLAGAFGLVDGPPGRAPFADVPATAPRAGAVAAVAARGWMVGVGGGRFAPDLPATRAEAAVALARALKLPGPGRARVWRDGAAVPRWARGPLAAAAAAGLVRGYPDGAFRPGTPLAPSQAETLLRRADRLAPPPARPAGVRLRVRGDRVDVLWRAVDGAARYTVDRRAPGGPWVAVGSTTHLLWGDRHAAPATAYAYRVRAIGARGTASAPGPSASEPALSASEASWTRPLHFSVATLLGLRQAAAAGPGTPLGLGGLHLSALPAMAFSRVDAPGGTLFFSDAPETVTAPAVLSRASVSGRVRAFFDLVNATGAPAEFALVLVDPGPGTVAYAVYRGLQTDTGGPTAEGIRVSADLVAPAPPGGVQRGELGPGGAVALDPGSPTLPDGANLVGTYDLRLSGPATLATVLAPAPWDAATYFRGHGLPLAGTGAGLGAGRGAFGAGSVREIAIDPPAGLPAALLLADGHHDPFLGPRDALPFAAAGSRPPRPETNARDFGNYGVLYRIQGRPAVPTALIGVPVGGPYRGAVGIGAHAFAAPSRAIPPGGSSGFLLAIWPAGRRSELDWTPPAASDLPLLLVTVPLG